MATQEQALLPRRHYLWQAGGGLGGIALAWLLNREAAAAPPEQLPPSPYAPKPSHFPARAKRVVQIFSCGGVSHVDTFDHKPELARSDGKTLTGKGKIDTFFGKPGNLMKSPFAFRQYGRCGQWVSSLFPHL